MDSWSIDPCPCCRCRTGCSTCPVCFWTDDGRGTLDVPVRGGPNGDLTLREARLNYAIYRACHPRYAAVVRPPRASEQV